MLHGALYFVPVFLVTNIVGGTWEMIFGIIRRHDINEGFLVTGMLFPLVLPPTIPLWQVALGISFGVVFGKEVFGGTGKNFLNPALTARAFLYFAYPGQIIGDKVWVAVDSYTGPTLLTTMGSVRSVAPDSFQTATTSLNMSWFDAFMGWIPGSMGETSTLACILGAAFLIITGVGSWRIMAGVLIGSMGLAGFLNVISSETNAVFQIPAHWHLVTGGLAFGLVYMATDPVSAAMTETGKWVYGILIGAMTIVIRVLNPAFPEGIMLAILFGNVFAPVIDYFVIQQNIKRRMARNAA
jgi:Na+-transporting NADH:ubiquinone oxidoreductase subunit B